MSKAILVLDEMPKYCNDCYMYDGYFDYSKTHYGDIECWCSVVDKTIGYLTEKEIKDRKNLLKPDWCPLKPLPDKKEECFEVDEHQALYAGGWNDCIDDILGE